MTYLAPMFVYGTLRAGEALSHLLPQDAKRLDAHVRGRLHYAPGTEGYPVLLPGDATDKVAGELMYLDLDNRDVQYVLLMEVGSGYSATWADVYLPGEAVRALVFTWHPKDGYGERIAGDDWTERNGATTYRYFCQECDGVFPSLDEALECENAHTEHDYDDAVSRILARHDS